MIETSGGVLFFLLILYVFGFFEPDSSHRSRGITENHNPSLPKGSDENESKEKTAFSSDSSGDVDSSHKWHVKRLPAKVRENIRPASPTDYAKWLEGHLKRGGEIRYERNRDLDSDYFVATGDFYLPRMCGAKSIALIVPEDTNVVYHDRGHSRIMWMDGFKFEGAGVESFKETYIQNAIKKYG